MLGSQGQWYHTTPHHTTPHLNTLHTTPHHTTPHTIPQHTTQYTTHYTTPHHTTDLNKSLTLPVLYGPLNLQDMHCKSYFQAPDNSCASAGDDEDDDDDVAGGDDDDGCDTSHKQEDGHGGGDKEENSNINKNKNNNKNRKNKKNNNNKIGVDIPSDDLLTFSLQVQKDSRFIQGASALWLLRYQLLLMLHSCLWYANLMFLTPKSIILSSPHNPLALFSLLPQFSKLCHTTPCYTTPRHVIPHHATPHHHATMPPQLRGVCSPRCWVSQCSSTLSSSTGWPTNPPK